MSCASLHGSGAGGLGVPWAPSGLSSRAALQSPAGGTEVGVNRDVRQEQGAAEEAEGIALWLRVNAGCEPPALVLCPRAGEFITSAC